MGSSPQRIHLLHVDDEPELAELAAELMNRTDDRISVDIETSASEALDLLGENSYDCVVSDYDMQGQDGIEFLKAVRDNYPELPFILYTGKGSEEVASDAIAAGVTDYLQKESGTSQYEILANRIRNAVEGRRASQTNRETQQWTSTLLEYSSDYLFVVDESGQLSYISPSVERVLGYTPEEVTGASALEFTYPDDIEKATEAFTELLDRTNEDVSVEFRSRHADGTYRWLEVRGRNLLDDPVIEGILVNARDITERKEREKDLRQIKREYESVFNTAQDAIFLWEVEAQHSEYEFRLQRLNPAHEAISGLSTETDRGKTPQELLGEETGAEVAANYMRCVEAREPISYEEELEMPSGTIHWQTKLGPVIRDGEVTQIVGVARDITEAVERERELREKSRLLEQIFAQIPTHLYVMDNQARILRVSEYYVDNPEERIGLTDREIAPGEFGEQAHADNLQVVESGEPLVNKEEYLSGRDRWGLTSKVPWYDDDGEIAGLLGVTRDITKRKEYEQELERQNEQLEEFAKVISHDLRNPMNVARGRLQLAGEECESDHLGEAADAVDRSLALIDDLLTLARNGRQISEVEPVDLAATVEECWRTVQTADATLDVESERTIRGDPGRIQQLLENLISNAVEHGGEDVTVTVADLEDGFYVEDDGPGIPADEHEQVFDAGYSTAEEEGGFGLNIVEQIVEAHGWQVAVTEGENGGARFEVTGVEGAAE